MSLMEAISRTVKPTNEGTVNFLIAGDYGTGKTHICSTARQPIVMHSFDSGGSDLNVFVPMFEKGTAFVQYFLEDSNKNPSAFSNWEKSFNDLLKSNAFEEIGTYVIDPLTAFSKAVMNKILLAQGRAGTTPQQGDWYIYQNTLSEIIKRCTNLPCDFIMTAHLETNKDDVTGQTIATMAIEGKSKIMIPALFSEVYVSETVTGNNAQKNAEFRIITQPFGRYRARTRIGGGIFDTYEQPDIMKLREKAGRSVSHLKPIGA